MNVLPESKYIILKSPLEKTVVYMRTKQACPGTACPVTITLVLGPSDKVSPGALL